MRTNAYSISKRANYGEGRITKMYIAGCLIVFGALLGYSLARVQLRGRFLLAAEAAYGPQPRIRTLSTAWQDITRTSTLPSSWCRPEDAPLHAPKGLTLAEQWNLPHRPPIDTEPHLIITPRCPDGYSAKQILGYTTIGREPTPPQYPGGFEVWKELHAQ